MYPLFCAHALQVTRCMHLIGWRLAWTARRTCRARAVDHFLPGCLNDGQLQLCMYLLCDNILMKIQWRNIGICMYNELHKYRIAWKQIETNFIRIFKRLILEYTFCWALVNFKFIYSMWSPISSSIPSSNSELDSELDSLAR